MTVDFRDLRVWDEAMGLAEAVYEVTGGFPKDERYGLVSQMRRASVSVPSGIAEGMLLSHRLGFITEEASNAILQRLNSVSFLLQSLRKALNAKLPRRTHSPFPIPSSRS